MLWRIGKQEKNLVGFLVFTDMGVEGVSLNELRVL